MTNNVNLNYAQPTPVPPPNLISTSIRMIISLLIVVALIYLVVYILKKYSYPASVGSSDLIKVISFSYLRGKEMLYLVKVGNKLILLGVTPNNISFITSFKEEDFEIEFKEKLEQIENKSIKTVAEELKRSFGRKR